MRVDRELSDAEDLQAAINVAWVLLCTALVFCVHDPSAFPQGLAAVLLAVTLFL